MVPNGPGASLGMPAEGYYLHVCGSRHLQIILLDRWTPHHSAYGRVHDKHKEIGITRGTLLVVIVISNAFIPGPVTG